MQITCECQKFEAKLKAFPSNTPGRLKCYCDDCQAYYHHLGRADLLDVNGGCEIIPAYPAEVEILRGRENLKCIRLTQKGMYRFSTTCCNTPIGNSRPGTPWLGLSRASYSDKTELDRVLGPVRASIMGKFAKGTPPKGTPQTFSFKGFLFVMPYVIKGKLLKKSSPSPFFSADFKAVVQPKTLTEEEQRAARHSAGV